MSVSILGAGTWGLALANLLSKKGNKVTVWCHTEEEARSLDSKRAHPRFSGVKLSSDIVFTSDIRLGIGDSRYIVYAVPSPFIREVARKSAPYIKDDMVLVSVAKGLEDKTFLTMSEVIEEEAKHRDVVALSGPTHAEEVALGLPTACVAASLDTDNAKEVSVLFSTDRFRVYTNDDPKGVELCGALKNIIALAAGITDGIGYGDNVRAALLTRGLAEIKRLGMSLGAKEATFYGLAGVGDLIVTANSQHSRNHECGYYIGQGYDVDQAVAKVAMAVEGLNALEAAIHLKDKEGIDMPIIEAVHNVVYGIWEPLDAVNRLFGRDLKRE